MKIQRWQLDQRLSLPLEAKIVHTLDVITEALDRYDGEGYLSFSGGLDSTVLYHLIKKEGLDKQYDIHYVFADNQMEDERNRAFINQLDDVTVVRTDMTVKEVIEQDGYPIGSKLTSRKIRDLQNPTPNNAATRRLYEFGIRKDGTMGSPRSKLANKWLHLVDSPFKFSEKCCNRLKKEPFKKFEKDNDIKLSITGERADESSGRTGSYLKTGCNNWRNHMSSLLHYGLTKTYYSIYMKMNYLIVQRMAISY